MATGEDRKASMKTGRKMQDSTFPPRPFPAVTMEGILMNSPVLKCWSAEILLWENQIRIFSHNADGLAHKLAEELKAYGLEPKEHFCSPCG